MSDRGEIDRTVLPIPDSPFEGELPLDAKDPSAKFPPIEELRPPVGAPNVLVVLLYTDPNYPKRPKTAGQGREEIPQRRVNALSAGRTSSTYTSAAMVPMMFKKLIGFQKIM